ncbi:50S ribosomal protein L10 [Anoxybacter fermentans]|uniref:Large ribosomal subunit protein uL10 n=1 Tax=Anoxybacter fermentans TaxID=1323375 RepID=A0A3Q9HT67_9FIRM|nr:50S ribosomal protein L10 [Anoxybacter fermentans]AZR74709.1 50S ribosomal protein L10 [Anoxybacter fermentans]
MARIDEKKKIVEEIAEKMNTAKSMVITDYRGLNVAEVTELRKKLREAGVEFKVIKNTLTRLAAQKAGIEGLDEILTGPNAIAFGMEDPVSPAKILVDFAKEHEKLEIKAGILDKNVIGPEKVKDLADIPPKEVLLSMVLRGMQGPISGLVNVLQGTIRNLVYVLSAIKEQKA